MIHELVEINEPKKIEPRAEELFKKFRSVVQNRKKMGIGVNKIALIVNYWNENAKNQVQTLGLSPFEKLTFMKGVYVTRFMYSGDTYSVR